MGFKVANTSFGGGSAFLFDIPHPNDHTLYKGIATISFRKVAIFTLSLHLFHHHDLQSLI